MHWMFTANYFLNGFEWNMLNVLHLAKRKKKPVRSCLIFRALFHSRMQSAKCNMEINALLYHHKVLFPQTIWWLKHMKMDGFIVIQDKAYTSIRIAIHNGKKYYLVINRRSTSLHSFHKFIFMLLCLAEINLYMCSF